MSIENQCRDAAVEFLEAYVPNGIDAVRERITEDFVWWTPTSGEIQDRLSSIKEKTRELYKAPPIFTITGVTAQDDRVAIEATSDGTLINGRHYYNRYHFLIKVRGNKVCLVREYSDTKHVAEVWAGLL